MISRPALSSKQINKVSACGWMQDLGQTNSKAIGYFEKSTKIGFF